MKVYLNVRINITETGRTFTVWPRSNRFLPGIEFHTGMADNLSDAVALLRNSMPDEFPIDDEISVSSASLDFVIVRPFGIVKSDIQRVFILA